MLQQFLPLCPTCRVQKHHSICLGHSMTIASLQYLRGAGALNSEEKRRWRVQVRCHYHARTKSSLVERNGQSQICIGITCSWKIFKPVVFLQKARSQTVSRYRSSRLAHIILTGFPILLWCHTNSLALCRLAIPSTSQILVGMKIYHRTSQCKFKVVLPSAVGVFEYLHPLR